MLPQSPLAPEGLSVGDLVARGRHPHQRWFAQWSPDDERAVVAALRATDTLDLAQRSLDELSGGQRQRAWIAMALAQETEVLLLDEPTTFLDLAHQHEVLELLCDLNEREGRTMVLVLHDLNQACRYAHHLVAMRDGAIVAEGAPGDVIDAQLVRDVFGLEVQILRDPRRARRSSCRSGACARGYGALSTTTAAAVGGSWLSERWARSGAGAPSSAASSLERVRDRAVQAQRGAAVAVVDDLDLAQVDASAAAAGGRRARPTRP